jgi:hypothetical protein
MVANVQVVSHSELVTAKRCSFRHQLGYVERWSKPAKGDSALGKGIAWHTVLEAHYRVIQACQRTGVISQAEILERCEAAVRPMILADLNDELGELIWWMYSGHVACYGTDPGWQILAVEHAAEVALPLPSGRPSRFRLKIKVDLIVRERSTGRIRIVDHKSGKDLPGKKALELDDQFALYQWGLTQLGRKVYGLTYSAARTLRLKDDIRAEAVAHGIEVVKPGLVVPAPTPLDERFARIDMHRTDKEMRQIAVEAYLVARARYEEQRAVTTMGIDSPRSTDPLRCPWDCDFYIQCLAGRKGMDFRDMLHRTGFAQQFERH